jgi:glycosyltransferase involved in cell wall biosynthesis
MNKLALFSFIKDEIDFITSFIEHHKNIFDEITIIDNGSKDGTLEILQEYEKNNIITLIKDQSPFFMKGEICSAVMENSSCDLLVGLDADEIIIFDDDDIRTKNTGTIKNYLQNIDINGFKYKVKRIYEYHPDNDGWYGIRGHTKIIFPKSTFLYTDVGFHRGRTTLDPESDFNTNEYYWRTMFKNRKIDPTNKINISYLHYHFKSKEIWLKNTAKKLKARIGDNWMDKECLSKYHGPSIHLKYRYLKYLNTNEWISCKKKFFLGKEIL